MSETIERPELTMKPDELGAYTHHTMTGRRKLKSKLKEGYTHKQLVDDVLAQYMKHINDKADVDYLYNYEKGVQPILARVKEVRPEINNKIVENRAHEIIQFKVGYQFGSGGFYVRRDAQSERVEELNSLMSIIGKDASDLELGYWLFLCGRGFRLILPSDDDIEKIELTTLDPRYTNMVYKNDLRETPLYAFTYSTDDTGVMTFYGYTNTHYFEIHDGKLTTYKRHTLPLIPIVEYRANQTMMGAFERVIGMLDGINKIQSDRINGTEQFVQALMKIINADIDDEDIKRIPDLGAIKIFSKDGNPADVQLMTSELNQQQTQTLKDDMYQAVLTICSMPDRKATSAGDTGSAVELRDGWANAETEAKQVEAMFKRSEKDALKLITFIMNELNGSKLDPSNIDVKFLRSARTDRVSASQAMINEKAFGIHPAHVIKNSGLYPDPEQVYEDSIKTLEKLEQATVSPEKAPGGDSEEPQGTQKAQQEKSEDSL